jgi:hypothetical protein
MRYEYKDTCFYTSPYLLFYRQILCLPSSQSLVQHIFCLFIIAMKATFSPGEVLVRKYEKSEQGDDSDNDKQTGIPFCVLVSQGKTL